jgi:guanylate kinase
MSDLIITVTGPSSSGKTVLSNMLKEKGDMVPLISTTTRQPRKNEVDGVDYHFVSENKFKELMNNGGLIEHVTYDNNWYGVSVEEAQRAFSMGKTALLVAEPEGSKQIQEYAKKLGWKTLKVFLFNPKEVLIERMLERFFLDVNGFDIASNEFKSKLLSHGKRMLKVLDFEQKNWVEPALNEKGLYDVIFDSFNASNTDEVFNKVIELAQKKIISNDKKLKLK